MTVYTIKPGDTLMSIAVKYGVSVERICADNGLSPETELVVGQDIVLLVPLSVYTVKSGDTLFDISERSGVGIYKLLQNNPSLMGKTEIYPGQTIVLSEELPLLGEISVGGFAYTYIDEDSLRSALPYLTYLSVFSYGINEDGTLIEPENDERLILSAREYGTVPLLVFTSLNSQGVFSSELVNSVLSDETLRSRVKASLIETVKGKGYGGVDFDFEYIREDLSAEYARLIREVRDELGSDYTVFCDLAPKTSGDMEGLLYEAHDYPMLGSAATKLFLMTYEWGYSYGPPMAVSPVENVRRVIEYGVSAIPPEKLFMGIPAYGYDWKLPYVKGDGRAQTLSSVEAVELARQVGAEIMFDNVSMAPYFNYTDTGGAKHEVWFQNARSIEALSRLAAEYTLDGIAVWNLMRYFPSLWATLRGLYSFKKPK